MPSTTKRFRSTAAPLTRSLPDTNSSSPRLRFWRAKKVCGDAGEAAVAEYPGLVFEVLDKLLRRSDAGVGHRQRRGVVRMGRAAGQRHVDVGISCASCTGASMPREGMASRDARKSFRGRSVPALRWGQSQSGPRGGRGCLGRRARRAAGAAGHEQDEAGKGQRDSSAARRRAAGRGRSIGPA